MITLRNLGQAWLFLSTISLTAGAQSVEPATAIDRRADCSWRSLVNEQLWSDVLVHGAWRIQRHELRGRFRLLDPSDDQRLSGTEQQCRAELTRLKRSNVVPPLAGKAVITLHGFARSREHMQELGTALADRGKFTWINVNYASTRGSIEHHAASLAGIIAGLEGIDEIHFVCHSLGNLVVRRYLHEAVTSEPRWQSDPRIRRMVMLGPPNQGARAATLIAEILHDDPLARLLTGPSAWQLARQWDDVSQQLAIPRFDFGILAGGIGDGHGLNPLLTGDDDFVVCVAETRLPGAADFRLVPCRHGLMMRDERIQNYVIQFLEHGWFTCPDEKQPIPSAVPAPVHE